jgi:hypothetical protein
MNPKYLRPGFYFALAHAIEEAGEFLAAAGKTQRWGRTSTNPELPAHKQETNEAWLRREAGDLQCAIDRLVTALDTHPATSRDCPDCNGAGVSGPDATCETCAGRGNVSNSLGLCA